MEQVTAIFSCLLVSLQELCATTKYGKICVHKMSASFRYYRTAAWISEVETHATNV
jgi:hypothetical protein